MTYRINNKNIVVKILPLVIVPNRQQQTPVFLRGNNIFFLSYLVIPLIFVLQTNYLLT